MINYLLENWIYVATILITLISSVIHMCHKRPVARNFKDWCDFIVTNYLPQLIINAEKLSPCAGETKKADVIEHALSALSFFIKLSDEDSAEAEKIFSKAIEDILATPRKKG